MTDTTKTLEAPGRFELPNKGFADDAGTAADGHAPDVTGVSAEPGGRQRTDGVGASRARTGPHDEEWTRRAALAAPPKLAKIGPAYTPHQ